MMKKLLFSIFCCLIALTHVQAGVVTGNAKKYFGETITSISSFEVSPVTLTFEKQNGATAPAYNAAGDCRIYAKGTITAKCAAGKLTKLVFTISTQGKKRLPEVTPSTGTVTIDTENRSTVIWEGYASSLVLTVGETAVYGKESDKAGQLCFTDFTATYDDGNAHDFEVNGIYYNITSSAKRTVEVTCRGSSYSVCSNEYTGSVVIPESVKYNGYTYSVTSIGNGAFRDCSDLTSIEIPNSVTSIGDYAFRDCSGLTSIEISNSVTSIGWSAFEGCSGLKKVELNCSTVGNWFKGNKSIEEIVIGDGVTSILGNAFSDFSSLARIIVAEENPVYDCRDNCNAIIETKTNTLITGCKNAIIPKGILIIGGSAFSGCSSLTSIEIPNSVTSIGNSAFYDCSGLASVEIPNSVTSIEGFAFSGCSGLTAVHISDLLAWCNIYYEENNSNPLYYAKNLYLNGELVTELIIPDDVTSIGNSAFFGCSCLTNIEIPNSVTSIGWSAFEGCENLKTVINFSSLIITNGSSDNGYIGYYADNVINATIEGEFAFCLINGVNTLVRYIGNKTAVVLPDNYHGESYVIGTEAFKNKASITSIEIPNSVTSIGNGAFHGCTSLKNLRIEDGEGTLFLGYNGSSKGLFYDCPLGTLYLGRNLSYNTSSNYGYSPFYNKTTLTSVTIGNSVTSIGDSAFDGCCSLTSVVISNSVTSIGNEAFYGCSCLTNIEIPNSVTSIGGSAFSGCSGLTSIEIPNSVTSIGNEAFYGCFGLTNIEIPNSVTSIGGSAFSGCSGLTNVVIPNSVTSIGNYAFDGCSGLKKVELNCSTVGDWFNGNKSIEEIVIGDGVTSIGYNAFSGCSGLASVEIPNSVTSIEGFAFSGCSGLTSITIPNSVTTIGTYAFMDCNNVESLYIGNSIQKIGDYAFAGCNNLFDIKVANKKVITISENIFSVDSYNNAILYVPKGRSTFYRNITPWSKFIVIEEFDFDNIEITGISLNKSTVTITEGETETLTATVNPSNATDQTVTWTTSDASVATVDGGVVTAVKAGTATITATAGGYSASCVVTVEAAVYPITSLAELSNSSVYYICQPHHSKGATSWAVATNGNALKSNKDLNIATDMNDTRQQFAILSIDGGLTRYLYHVATQKFVNKDGSLSATSVDAISFMNGAYDNTFFAYFDGSHYVNVGGSQQMIIDGWSIPDGGNSCSIIPVGEFDSATALKAINDFVTGIEEVKGKDREVKTIYDLQGREVTIPTKGIYIINGKKVLVK